MKLKFWSRVIKIINIYNNKNSKGPKTEPCGTPQVIGSCSDITIPTDTYCFLFERYDENHFCAIPLIPLFSSFFNNIVWFTVSKALLKSRKMPHEYILFSIDFWILSAISKIACVVEWFARNPNCPWNITWFFPKMLLLFCALIFLRFY